MLEDRRLYPPISPKQGKWGNLKKIQYHQMVEEHRGRVSARLLAGKSLFKLVYGIRIIVCLIIITKRNILFDLVLRHY
jgi:hypothetical protein